MVKKKTTKPVYQSQNSKAVFLLAITIFLLSIVMFIITQEFIIFTLLIIFSVICYIPAQLSYKFRKYIITNNKIYVYDKDKKILGWTFSDDFLCVDYKQSKIGKIFNFGDLYISNRNNQFYLYKNISNPKEAYDKTIIQYEKIAVMLDPNYIPRYNSNNATLNPSGDNKNIDRVKTA